MSGMSYVTEIYCENPQCNARQCEIVTKDHGDVPEPTSWRCPACGRPAKVHWRRDAPSHRRIELARALGRVNAALYRRDRNGCGYPISALALSELPNSWKAVTPPKKGEL
jgi:hypothetical protein